eukprot:g2811.t1
MQDLWNRPIASAPTSWIEILDREILSTEKPLKLTGSSTTCLNLGSYNYLGFASSDAYCTPRVLKTLKSNGWSTCSPRSSLGTLRIHQDLEKTVAKFIGVEDAITFGMGFATNSFVIPALVGKGCLVLSDALNHASIVSGVRTSGAKVQVFRHNDVQHLEALLKSQIANGQPRTHRPWKKVLIIVEGIYSMEGEMCHLREIIELKKQYKAYLYLDEAHSIGALGKTGRGICEQQGVDPRDVDIMMGTFTKSFGSCGGYIGGPKKTIQYIRSSCPTHHYAASMSPAAAEQIISAFKLLQGEDGTTRGTDKVKTLHENANYFRQKLVKMGLDVLGDWNSPVMPIMLYAPGKLRTLSKECLKRNLATVVVGFPATTLTTARARICISASHTKEDLDFALDVLDEMASLVQIRYNKNCSNEKTLASNQIKKSTNVVKSMS